MALRFRAASAAVALLAAGFTVVGAPAVHANPGDVDHQASVAQTTKSDNRSADYLTSSPDHRLADYVASGTVSYAASGQDQCSLPIGDRTGAWVCLSEPTTSGATGAAPQVTTGGNCNSHGACWYVTDRYHAHNNMSGWFGWGSTQLGSVNYSQYHSLNGSQMITKPHFDTSTSVKNLEAEGDLLHGSHYDEGSRVAGQTDWTSKSKLAADGYWRPWGTTGYKSYSKSYLNHANVVEVSWEKGDYAGYWWMYQKSVIAEDPDGNNWYDFQSPTYRFASSADIGYHS